MRPDLILKKLQKAVEAMEVNLAEEAAAEAIAAGTEPMVAINEGLAKGMKTISDRFDEGDVFVPHLLVAADAFEAGAAVLTDSMLHNGKKFVHRGKILIFTVQGDIHDIGKNIVKIMLQVNGFEVIDLGRDIAASEAVKAAVKFNVDIIIATALMCTTMPAQRALIKELEEEGVRGRFKCIFGGSPVTSEWVRKIGGDAYAETATMTVEIALKMVGHIDKKTII